jgi:hypothetical protein
VGLAIVAKWQLPQSFFKECVAFKEIFREFDVFLK